MSSEAFKEGTLEDGSGTTFGSNGEEKPSIESNTEINDSFPDGGLEAWLVVLGATVAIGCSLGYVNAFG